MEERLVEQDSESKKDTCCCCIPLRTGCLIYGYLQLVGNVLGGIGALVFICYNLNPEGDETQKHMAKVLVIFVALVLVMVLLALPFTVLLLVGLHQDKRPYIKRYVLFSIACMAINIILQIVKLSKGYAENVEIQVTSVGVFFNMYCLRALLRYHKKLGLNSDNQIA